jgi:wyosine [tRNA(Phe)-imidazoG37] synthetase (radical SAM superfamily)
LGVRIAVISNGSLAWREEVKGALLKADWLSLKVDAVREDTWRRIDRPHGSLSLPSIQDGMLALAAGYTGQLATETMLLGGVNDSERELEEVAAFLARLQPRVAYLSVPIRPPAESRVRPPGEASLNRAFQILSQVLGVERVEYLIGYEGNAFAFTGDVERDLLSITAVHPMRQDAVEAFLARAQSGRRAETEWEIVQRLVAQNQLVATEYGGHRFYLRKLGGGSG